MCVCVCVCVCVCECVWVCVNTFLSLCIWSVVSVIRNMVARSVWPAPYPEDFITVMSFHYRTVLHNHQYASRMESWSIRGVFPMARLTFRFVILCYSILTNLALLRLFTYKLQPIFSIVLGGNMTSVVLVINSWYLLLCYYAKVVGVRNVVDLFPSVL